MSAPTLPVCGDADQLLPLDGRCVLLVGIYTPILTLKKMRRPGAPRVEVELGDVVIALTGTAQAYDAAASDKAPAWVALSAGLRPADEIARYRDRRVSVKGRLLLTPTAIAASAVRRPAPQLLDPRDLRIADSEGGSPRGSTS